MKLELVYVDKEKEKYCFLVKGVDYNFMNFLRRSIMSEVPTMAVDEVVFYKNDSIMPDEQLANRIGLVPVKGDISDTSKGYIKKKGGIVYSGDIQSNDVEILYKNIALTKLKKDDEIEVELKMAKGYGKDHVKWQPALVYYRELAEVLIKDKVPKEIEKMIADGALKKEGNKMYISDHVQYDFCKYCLEEAGIEVKILDDSFYLYLELFKNKDLEDIVIDVDNYLKEYFKKISAKLK